MILVVYFRDTMIYAVSAESHGLSPVVEMLSDDTCCLFQGYHDICCICRVSRPVPSSRDVVRRYLLFISGIP